MSAQSTKAFFPLPLDLPGRERKYDEYRVESYFYVVQGECPPPRPPGPIVTMTEAQVAARFDCSGRSIRRHVAKTRAALAKAEAAPEQAAAA